jgi:hypothetical protein
MPEMPPLPASFARTDVEACGFVGWWTWDQLRKSEYSRIPQGPVAYVIYRSADCDPTFLDDNPAYHFKQQDPTVAREVLEANWVPACQVVYIGKANEARKRLKQFSRFGAGEKDGHWGGRYVWQLADSADQVVGWHAITWGEMARDYEKRLLAHFASLHGGRRPFANLTG